MAPSEADLERCLAAARAGSAEALGALLEPCRAYLLWIARRELDPNLHAKGSASDLVQETFLEAQRDFGRFHGQSETELRAWLRLLLLHNLRDFSKRYQDTGKRALVREVSMDRGSLAARFADGASSPCTKAVQQEEEHTVRQALERLPEDYRQVLLLRYEQGLSFEEIGEAMGRSANAARKLWLRALEHVEQELESPP
jgi:RNA polymerase sigma-70 factor (ECF subfamily)